MNLTPGILNVIRVALDRADMNYRVTGFKPFEIEAAKVWVKATAPTPAAQADSVLEDAQCWRLIVDRLDEPNIDTVAHIRNILAARKQGGAHD